MKSGMEIRRIPPLILLYKQLTLFFRCVIGAVLPSANVSERNKSRSAAIEKEADLGDWAWKSRAPVVEKQALALLKPDLVANHL